MLSGRRPIRRNEPNVVTRAVEERQPIRQNDPNEQDESDHQTPMILLTRLTNDQIQRASSGDLSDFQTDATKKSQERSMKKKQRKHSYQLRDRK